MSALAMRLASIPMPTSTLARYTSACGWVALATMAKLLAGNWLAGDPNATYLAAVGLAAWFGGARAGVVATGLAVVAQTYFFLAPSGTFWIGRSSDVVELAAWAAEGLVLCGILGALHTLRRRADLLAGESAARADALAMANHVLQQEVSERIAAEDALRESGEAHRLLFAASPLPMWVVDAETHRFLAVNAAAIGHYGYSQDEFLSRSLSEVRSEDDVPASPVGDTPLGDEWTNLARHRRRDGHILHIEVHARRHSFGGRPAWLAALNDVSTRLALEEKLRQAQKMEAIGRLAGGVAHDFNNLLSIILSYTSMMVDEMGESDPLRADLVEVHAAGERAAELTRQLLAFGRQQLLKPRVIELGVLVADMHSMLRRLLGEDITLHLSQIGGACSIKVDPGQLEQVVMNLAVNARDAMPSGGRLTIATTLVDLSDGNTHALPAGRYGMLSVSDSGAGMDAATSARIFEPFFTTKAVGKGTGLGLATVFGIVRQSGGSIDVESQPGRGATFRIYFPSVDAEEAPVVLSVGSVPRSLRRETVLLVEDEAAVRQVTHDLLTRLGYRVLVADCAHEAVRIATAHEGAIDVLLTDIVMPGMDGATLAAKLSDMRPEMKAICMSGYAGEHITQRGITHEGIAFLQKPITPASLGRKLRDVLGEYPSGPSARTSSSRIKVA